MGVPNFDNRALYHGDNLDFLRSINSESVDLIATDPPFNKGRDFPHDPSRPGITMYESSRVPGSSGVILSVVRRYHFLPRFTLASRTVHRSVVQQQPSDGQRYSQREGCGKDPIINPLQNNPPVQSSLWSVSVPIVDDRFFTLFSAALAPSWKNFSSLSRRLMRIR